MAEYKLPPAGGSYADTLARVQAEAQAVNELDRKANELQQTEERGRGTETRATGARGELAGATRELSSAVSHHVTAIADETTALRASTAALEAKLGVVLKLRDAEAQLAAATGGARGGGYGGGGGGSRPVAAAAPFDDGNERYRASLQAQAQAERDAKAAAAAYTTSVRPGSAASAEDSAALLARREQAAQALAASKAETQAAVASARAETQQAEIQAQGVREAQLRNLALKAERQAAEQAAAEMAVHQQLVPVGRASSRALVPTGGSGGAVPIYDYLGYQHPRTGPEAAARAASASVPAFEPIVTGSAGAEAKRYEEAVGGLQGRLGAMGTEQAIVNQRFQAASASYADASTALSRHGALTTEFIAALARGQVTLGEFGSQVTATIGKFGGWAVAAGAVYGVYDALKHVVQGATETQGAVQNLGRFIPGLGGPAGGGRSQIPAAENTLRNLSSEFNVPISEVSSAMQVMARTFHTVSDAGQATAAVLAATRLDQVPQSESEQYLVGIGNALNFRSGSQLVGVINSLNELQAQFGARVNQTLPALSKSVPAALAGGIDLQQLEALSALGVRGGISGNQVGTALLRSISTFAFRPASASIFGEYGISPKPGQYGDLIGQVIKTIDTRAENKTLQGTDLRNLAQALGGPLLGGRSILPILEQEASRPGFYDQAVAAANRPRSYTEDLGSVLGSVSEQFKSIGIDLQNFGSALAGIGVLTPLQALLTGVQGVASAMQFLFTPLTSVLGVFGQLPGPMKEALGLFIALKAGQALLGTRFGGAAQQFVGRLPGLSAFGNEDRAIVDSSVNRLQNFVIPQQRRELESAAARAQATAANARQAVSDREAVRLSNPQWSSYIDRGVAPVGLADDKRFQKYASDLANTTAVADRANQAAARARAESIAKQQVLETSRSDLGLLQGRGGAEGSDYAQRAAYAKETGIYIAQGDNDVAQQTLNARTELFKLVQQGAELQAQGNTIAEESLLRVRGGGGGVAAAGVVGGEAVGAFAVGAAARAASSRAYAGPAAGPFIVGPSGEVSRASIAPPGFASPAGASPAAGEGYLASFGLAGLAQRVQGAASRAAAAADTAKASVAEQGGIGAAARSAAGNIGLGPGLFAGTIAASLAQGIVGANSPIGREVGNVQTGLSAALFARLAGASTPLALAAGAAGQEASQLGQENTRGKVISLAATGVGAGIGALAGGPIGAAVGGWLGSTAGGIISSLFGGDNASPAEQQAKQVAAGLAAVRQAQRGGTSTQRFGGQIDQDLYSAFTGSGQTGSSSQAKLSTEVSGLQAEATLFGASSAQGKTARALLATAIQSAVQNAATNPQAAQQVLQASEQARSASVQNQFKYSLATGGSGGAQGAADTATEQYRAQTAVYTTAAQGALQNLAVRQQELVAAIASGNQNRIKVSRAAVATAQQNAAGAQAILRQTSEANALQIQAVQQQAYQVQSQANQASGALAQANAGGNQRQQLQAQLATAQKSVQLAGQLAPYDPTTAATDAANAQAQIIDAQNKLAQQNLTEIKSRGTVAEARVPSFDPVGQAQQKLHDLEQQYNYIKANAAAFDPSDIRAALAAVITGKQAVADATAQYRTQMIGINTQIGQAREYGDSVAQAATGVSGAVLTLNAARGPQQKAQAQLGLINAQNQQQQAQAQALAAEGALQASYADGNPVRQAEILLRNKEAILANARGVDNVRAAQQGVNDANYALQQAVQQSIISQGALNASKTADPLKQLEAQIEAYEKALANAKTPDARRTDQTALNNLLNQQHAALVSQGDAKAQLQEARSYGNSVRQAQIAVGQARRDVRAAQTPEQRVAAETQLAQAQAQLRGAEQQRQQSTFQLRESRETGNSVAQARTAIEAAEAALRNAHGFDQKRAAELQLSSAENQLHQAQQSRIAALGGLYAAEAQGDPLTAARIAVSVAQAELRNAKGTDERVAAATQLASAEFQYHQALQQWVSSLGALYEAQVQADPVAAAEIAVQTAQALVKSAAGAAELVQAETQLAAAQYALHQALQQQTTALGGLAASQTRDPLSQLTAQINAARKVLAGATGAAERTSAQTSLNGLLNQYTSTLISQTESTINFQLQMKQITSQQAIAQLNSLLNTQSVTLSERQQIESQIRQLQLGGSSSSFNLAPGNIKLPTVYDIARAVGGASAPSLPSISANAQTQINVYVKSASDVGQVADAIDRATGSQLAGALRAAGLR